MNQRAIVLSPGQVLTLERNLFPAFGLSQPATTAGAVRATRPPVPRARPRRGPSSLEEVERSHILEVVDPKWVIEGRGGTAQVLNLYSNTLRSRMKELEIQRP